MGYRYVQAPDFEVLLLGYSMDGRPVQVVDLARGEKIPNHILHAIKDEAVTKWAFNANFERICLSRYLGLHAGEYLNPSSWKCSMVWAATMGLPLSLEGVGTVLQLDKQKLTEGKDLLRYFCQPCTPTAVNDQRTRNLPQHAPDKWSLFKQYNARDVETEMAIQEKLSKFPVPDSIWEEYHLDQEINDRGVGLDMKLVRNAISVDSRSRAQLTAAMKHLTDLENPNSVQQMKQWLADNGTETNTLGKKAVAEMLKTAPMALADVLSLRQQLAKSSVRKYQAMQNEMLVVSELMQQSMYENAHEVLDQAEYKKHYSSLAERFDRAKARLEEVRRIISDKEMRQATIEAFLDELKRLDGVVEFQPALWYGLPKSSPMTKSITNPPLLRK